MKRLEEQLTEMAKPRVHLALHQNQLRRALLGSFSSDLGSFTRFYMFFNKLLPATLTLALVFGIAFVFRPEQTPDYVRYVVPTVSAQELVSQVLENLEKLTPEQLAEIAQTMGKTFSDEIMSSLTQAQNASDLSYVYKESISCEEALKKQEAGNIPTMSAFVFSDQEEAPASICVSAFILHAKPDDFYPEGYAQLYLLGANVPELTYVEYVNALGEHVLLGLTEDLLPYETLNLAAFDRSTSSFTMDQSQNSEMTGGGN